MNPDFGAGVTRTWALARLLLLDAFRRSGLAKRAVGFVLLLLVTCTVVPAAASILLLREALAEEAAGARQVLVVLAFTAASLLWLFVQVVLDRPMNFLLDLRPLLAMPVGFGILYRLRVGLSLVGWWCIAFGPAACYVVLARPTGTGEAALLVFGVLAVVLIHGCASSILQRWRQRLMAGWLGSAFLLGGLVAIFLLLMELLSLASGEAWARGSVTANLDGLNFESLRAASWFGWVSATPSGLLALIVEEPRVTRGNLTRLGTLWSVAIVLGLVDRGLLARRILAGLHSPGRTLGRTLPLAWLLRRLDRVSPPWVLSLIECESLLRERSLRWQVLLGVAILIVYSSAVPDLAELAILIPSLVTTVALNGHRAETTLSTGRVWKESFSLPTTLLGGVRAMGRVPSLVLAALLGGGVFLVALRHGSSLDWELIAYVACIAVSAVIVSDGFYGWYDVRWQSVRWQWAGLGAGDAGGKMLAGALFFVGLYVLFLVGLVGSLFGVTEVAPGIAVSAGLSIVVFSLVVWRAFRIRQARLVKDGGLELLVRRTSSSRR